MSTLRVIPPRSIQIAEDVRAAVQHTLDDGYPFVMMARRPNGTWERTVSKGLYKYELLGALEVLKHSLLDEDE